LKVVSGGDDVGVILIERLAVVSSVLEISQPSSLSPTGQYLGRLVASEKRH
jgi:hypothetical protein